MADFKFELLPRDVQFAILGRLSVLDLLKFIRTNKKLGRDNRLWKERLQKYYPDAYKQFEADHNRQVADGAYCEEFLKCLNMNFDIDLESFSPEHNSDVWKLLKHLYLKIISGNFSDLNNEAVKNKCSSFFKGHRIADTIKPKVFLLYLAILHNNLDVFKLVAERITSEVGKDSLDSELIGCFASAVQNNKHEIANYLSGIINPVVIPLFLLGRDYADLRDVVKKGYYKTLDVCLALLNNEQTKDNLLNNLLPLAILSGSIETVKCLIVHGANINQKFKNPIQSPSHTIDSLEYAILLQKPEMVYFLLKQKPIHNIKDVADHIMFAIKHAPSKKTIHYIIEATNFKLLCVEADKVDYAYDLKSQSYTHYYQTYKEPWLDEENNVSNETFHEYQNIYEDLYCYLERIEKQTSKLDHQIKDAKKIIEKSGSDTPLQKAIALFTWYSQQKFLSTHSFCHKEEAKILASELQKLGDAPITQETFKKLVSDSFKAANQQHKNTFFSFIKRKPYEKINPAGHFKFFEKLILKEIEGQDISQQNTSSIVKSS